jgi:uncharacterized PurR-regulated membrane protein YhhQ (DUF165 family)
MNRKATTAVLFAGYAATIPAANWMIEHVGTEAFPGGPHTIPVGFGYSAPSGVLMIGVALFARDLLQRVAGKRLALAAIAVGVALSFLLADPTIAVASAVAFACGEVADFAVYTPLARRSRVTKEHTQVYGSAWSVAYQHGYEPPVGQIKRWTTTTNHPGWLVGAVLASGVVGAFVDTFLFLQIAFGSSMFWQGQVIGKTYMAVVGAALIWGTRTRTRRQVAFA